MKVGILGSGFGLYGYLPAVTLDPNQIVVLPERYREKLLARADVGHLAADVEWVAGEEEVLSRCNAIIFSKRPSDQIHWAARSVQFPALQRLLLEKPIGPDPLSAFDLLQLLEKAGKTIRVGFTFRFTTWARELAKWLEVVKANARIIIRWRFRAYHYEARLNNWKRQSSHGGGALRFYGIHLIALLAEWGYSGTALSRVRGRDADEAEIWEAIITGGGLPDCHILVDTNCAEYSFEVTGDEGDSEFSFIRSLHDPFAEEPTKIQRFDRRVGVLSSLWGALMHDPPGADPLARMSVDLWSKIEQRTTRERTET